MRPLIALLVLASGSAHGTEYIREIKREPAVASGTSEELAKRAAACIAKEARIPAAPYIDGEIGIVVATTTIDGRTFVTGQQQIIQSKMTVDTKDGKFRISHSDVAVSYITKYEHAKYDFRPIEIGSKAAKDVEAALAASDEKVSKCIGNPTDDF